MCAFIVVLLCLDKQNKPTSSDQLRRGRSDAACDKLVDQDSAIKELAVKYAEEHLHELNTRYHGNLPKFELADIGWIHGADMLQPALSIYHHKGIDILYELCKHNIEVVIDDMSNLTRRITIFDYDIRLNHSIMYIRNPSGHRPILITEFINGSWKAKEFGLSFQRFWVTAKRRHSGLAIKNLGHDWYAGYHTELNKILNNMTVGQYCVFGIRLAAGRKV